MSAGYDAHGLRASVEEHGSTSVSLEARVIEDAQAWDAIRADWDRLYKVSPTASTPLDFAWLRAWWQIYGSVYGRGGLRIITLWRGPQLVGALPLYLEIGGSSPLGIHCLRFISTGEAEHEETCPDYMDLLHLPDDEMACAQAAWVAIDAMRWDTLELLDLPDDSSLLRWRTIFSRNARVQVIPRGACPIADLGDGFEEYLANLSPKTRMHARQYIREAKRSDIVLEIADMTDADRYFDDLIRIHQERWVQAGQPGCFSAPRFTEFHRCLVHEWVADGRVVLARLSHQGKPFAVLYGFVTGNKFDLYQLGVMPVDRTIIRSSGTAANLLLMVRLAERGIAKYDFLRGTSTYKKSLTTEQRLLVSVICRKPSVRALLDQMWQLLVRAGRRIAKLVTRSHSS